MSFLIHTAFNFDRAIVDKVLRRSTSLSSPISDPTFLTDLHDSSVLLGKRSMVVYSVLSVFTLSWCGFSFDWILFLSLWSIRLIKSTSLA